MKVLVVCTAPLFLLCLTAESQTSASLKSRFGNPDLERFSAAGIDVWVEYAADGSACQVVVSGHKDMFDEPGGNDRHVPTDEVWKLMDDLVPLSERGLRLSTYTEDMGCSHVDGVVYENGDLHHLQNGCAPQAREKTLRMSFKFRKHPCRNRVR